MSSILKYSVAFVYAVFAGISASLSSFNLRIPLFFGAFLLLFVMLFYDFLSAIFLILSADKKQKSVFIIIWGVMQRRL